MRILWTCTWNRRIGRNINEIKKNLIIFGDNLARIPVEMVFFCSFVCFFFFLNQTKRRLYYATRTNDVDRKKKGGKRSGGK
jgi:hypothetical protein